MSKKRDARVERKLAKTLRQQAKAVRLQTSPDEQVARSEYAKEAPRAIRTGANPGSIFQMQMTWTIEDADRSGSWTWGVEREWGAEVWASDLHPKLQEFEKLTWGEIESHAYGNEGKRHRSHHAMETDAVCDEAQGRLKDLAIEYPEVMFRFRLGNMPRLWGVRVVNQFQVIWYDPTHRIYPLD